MRSPDRATAGRGLRRSLSVALVGVLLATSVAAPLLDRNPDGPTPAVETEHHPGTCGVAHDHRICVLVATNLLLASADGHGPHDRVAFRTLPAPHASEPAFEITATLHHSRAPPVV